MQQKETNQKTKQNKTTNPKQAQPKAQLKHKLRSSHCKSVEKKPAIDLGDGVQRQVEGGKEI